VSAWEDPGATALIVPIPEAEAVLGGFRRAHTPSGAAGMPAHVTLMAPFSTERTAQVHSVVERFRAFQVSFARIERFEETRTVYLAPDPVEPFLDLVRALGGRDRVVPHLTVASRVDDEVTDAVMAALPALLPIEAIVRAVALLERGDDLRFGTVARFELRE
jgi:hypothetical protein